MKHKKTILAASLLAAALVTTGVTLAFLADSKKEIENVFEPTSVPIHVEETFDGTIKSNVAIQNLGNTSAYVRVAVIKNWLEGENIVYQETDPYDVTWEGAIETLNSQEIVGNWCKYGDYYYYLIPLEANDNKDGGKDITTCLIESCGVNYGNDNSPKYTLQVEILAQSVQSVPEEAMKDLWGVTISENGVTSVTEP